jgi:16S rRNA (adenine1518-N6/adenine1519-N6)-dimethyltransferase
MENDNLEINLPPLREVIATYGLAAKKSLGQNFLLDSNLTNRIAREAATIAKESGKPFSESLVIEIGPGPGGLTRSILSETGAKKLISIERDNRCIAAMQDLEKAFPNRFEVVEGDALKFYPVSLFEKYGRTCGAKHISIVANLPYNISTALLVKWLGEFVINADFFGCLTLMFQKEVAHRISAKIGTSSYGRLSILSQWLCEVKLLFDVNPKAFTPPPKVTSTVVSLVPRKAPLFDVDLGSLEAVTAAAFGQRRKMLRSSLKSLGDFDIKKACEYAGVNPTQRAEEISIEAYCKMADFIY